MTCQITLNITLNKAEYLEFGINNANVATSSYDVAIIYIYVYLSVLLAKYNITNEWSS